jgi:hypothetical protein
MPNYVGADVQCIIFGSAPQEDLIQIMGQLHRHQDAPKKLTDGQIKEVMKEPTVVWAMKRRKKALIKIKRVGYKSVMEAKNTPAGKEYDKYRKKLDSIRNTLLRKRLERAIKEFHDTIHAKEVDQQLKGMKPNDLLTSTTFELPERKAVAELSQVAMVKSRGSFISSG